MKSVHNQTGAVLIVGLVIVLVLSLLVIAATRTTVLQQKMTTNLRDKELAFQAAESALKEGEDYLESSTKSHLANRFDGTDGLHTFNSHRRLDQQSNWDTLNKRVSHALFQVQKKPEYIIEELPDIKSAGSTLAVPKAISGIYYRITSKAKGGTDASFVVLQSMYKK